MYFASPLGKLTSSCKNKEYPAKNPSVALCSFANSCFLIKLLQLGKIFCGSHYELNQRGLPLGNFLQFSKHFKFIFPWKIFLLRHFPYVKLLQLQTYQNNINLLRIVKWVRRWARSIHRDRYINVWLPKQNKWNEVVDFASKAENENKQRLKFAMESQIAITKIRRNSIRRKPS